MTRTTPPAPQPDAAPSARRRGRPRDAARDRALLDATLAVLVESGFGGLTTAAVATRAGVSTATLYRRWSSKEELVVAAAATCTEPHEPPATGTLEGDLRVVLRDKAAAMTGEGGRLMRALVGEAAHNTALAQALTAAVLEPAYRRVADVVRSAVERGEIPPVEDLGLLGDVVLGPVMSSFFFTSRLPEHIGPAAARERADRLLPFALSAVGGGRPPSRDASTGSADADAGGGGAESLPREPLPPPGAART
ncbi:TetR family transcriptional regulator [Streptomyces spongiicola]|uniref:TetR family transcriptional regulator n=1 Tax=Streptomyces spongiicola TaxID=1690221 RepID=A0A2S1Z3Z1_9ACTN|nr:TetR/AcrR family transcriptional regulator [Streptomyces spongiicola]AWK11056.1 TetR family transcriptional regulator [Streptomyces spongiicola]GBQ00244.1 TetR family transcriptional regulator [Streptomyces spongiicola]